MKKHYLANPTWGGCRMTCSYCWVRRHIDRILALANAAERPYEDWVAAILRDPPHVMDIGGGEPLSLPWTLELIARFPRIRWGLSTNGLYTDRIEEMAERKLTQIINVNLSYHPEAVRQVPDYDEQWKRQVLLLAKAGYPVGPNLEITPYNMRHAAWAIDWLTANGLHMVVSPLCGGRKELGYPQEQALVCEAGRAFITIAPDGRTWPCLSSLNSYAWDETSIGNWLDGEMDLSRKPQPCHLYCVEYNVQYQEHESGDFWGICARPATEQSGAIVGRGLGE